MVLNLDITVLFRMSMSFNSHLNLITLKCWLGQPRGNTELGTFVVAIRYQV